MRERMSVVFFILGFFALYLVAKILIPVLITILTLFTLLAAIAPFVLFIAIGLIIGGVLRR